MGLAIFDLDNTLLAGDSDYLWGRFLVEHGLVDGPEHERRNREFYEQYEAGTLDIDAFLRFQLAPLARHDRPTLEAWRERFMAQAIDPIILPAGRDLIGRHRARGDTPLIITATNRFVTGPIAERLGVETLLATEPEEREGRFTGRATGTPCFQEGKVERLEAWMRANATDLRESWFYSDSRNDLPLLERVTHPVAVDPDPVLRRQAQARGWSIISLRTAPHGS